MVKETTFRYEFLLSNVFFFTALLRHHQGFWPEKTISPAQGKVPSRGIFLWKLNLSSTGTEFHTQGNFGKTQSPHTPQHRAHTRGNFEKTQSPHTPQHRAHTQGNFEKTQSIHTPQHSAHTQRNYFPYRGIFRKNQSLPAREFFKNPQHRDFSWKTNLSSTGAVRDRRKKKDVG